MKKFTTLLLSASVMAGTSALAYADNWFDKEEGVKQELTLDLDGIDKLIVLNGAGDIELRGSEGRSDINAMATIVAPEDAEYILRLEREGDTAVLEARFEDGQKYGRHYIDLDIKAASSLALEVQDGSGDLHIEQMHEGLRLQDGSGDVELESLKGGADIQDGSGDLSIRDMEGDLDINDGSGDFELVTLSGNLDLTDGSGEVEIRSVTGDVEINDGSGDIEVVSVSGLVEVGDGSGDIDIAEAGDFRLRRDGSGRVEVDGVEVNDD